DLRLTIVRHGRTAFDAPLPKSDCGYCDSWPAGGAGAGRSVKAADLDGDGEPEVLVDLYTGGAHCCFFTYFFRYSGGTYVRTRFFWGNPGYRLRDLDRDGRPEIVSANDAFPYYFTSYAFSA